MMTAEDSTPWMKSRRWQIAAVLAVGVLVNYFDRVNLSVAKDALNQEWGITTFQFGLLSSAFNWTYAGLQLPMGVLLDRFGVKLMGRLGTFLWSIASFGSAISPNVSAFFVSRLLLGIGEAPTFPANAKAIGYWFPKTERSLSTALFDAAAKFAPAIGVLFVGVMTTQFGWRLSFAATGLISLLFFFLFYVTYRDPREDKHVSQSELAFIRKGGAQPDDNQSDAVGAPLTYLLRQRKVLGLVIGMFAYNYTFYVLLYWLPAYFSGLHLTTMQSAGYTSIPWLFATVTDLIIGGWLVDHLVRSGRAETVVRQSVLIGGTIVGMTIAGGQTAHGPISAVIWISIALGGLSAAAPVGWSIPSLIAPRNSVGRVGGILNLGNQIAGIVAPIVTGAVVAATNSYGPAFVICGGLIVLGVASYIFLLGKIEPVPEPA
jgi:MFS transporter, ACS family, D-galactonate transporter